MNTSPFPPSMKWEEDAKMDMEEMEAVLEKIWDIHDKLSDAIHSISRAHFLTSVKSRKAQAQAQTQAQADFYFPSKNKGDDESNDGKRNSRAGYVFMKDYGPMDEVDDSAVQEAKSLNAIRTALENLEDQLEFFHTVQSQQRAERDAAVARLEQSRIVLAMRLAEHHGKKYKVIEEARAFVGDVRDASRLISPENPYGTVADVSNEKGVLVEGKRPNYLNILLTKLNFVKKSLKLDHLGGVIGNAALVAISMLVLMHVHQAGDKGKYNLDLVQRQEEAIFKRNLTKVSQPEGSSSTHMDVLLARG